MAEAGAACASALRDAATRLAAVSDTPRLDAELLMAHALGVERDALLMRCLDRPAPDGFKALVERRMAHEPVAYIVGHREFWTIRLKVAPGVLIPRPDSEILIEACVEHARARQRSQWPRTILDLGTGPGTLLLAALDQFPQATGLGVDVSDAALALARDNADRIAPGRAAFRNGDWASAIEGTFDIILCNPPYVETGALLDRQVREWEPAGALFAGEDGLDAYRTIVLQLPGLIAPGGMIVVEIGHRQASAVSTLFRENGLTSHLRHDLAGRPRALIHFALGKPGEHG